MNRRWLTGLFVFGLVGVWFSFPLTFGLAAVGTYLIAAAASRKEWATAARFAAMSAVWAASFAACYKVSHTVLTKERFIWDWWNFAFLPIPPRSIADLERDFWHVINVLNSPAGVLTPLGVVPSAFLAAGVFAAGCIPLARRWAGGLFLLVAPLIFALAASGLHQYPFHGRLLLFLVPSLHLVIGEGAAALGRPGGRWLTCALGAFLLWQPAADTCWHFAIDRQSHSRFDSHGDLLPDLLDYFEDIERKSQAPRPVP